MKTVNSKLKVAVLTGGISSERDVSIQSGRCVEQALENAGLNVVLADTNPDNLEILEDCSIDAFFIAMHGEFGEDGQLQQILEDKSLIYTGSGPEASKLAFDKLATKKCLVKAGIITPAVIKFDAQTEQGELEKKLLQFGQKYVVKPVRQGSTIGVTIADNTNLAFEAARKCLDEFGDCMIEQFIVGREITVGILDNLTLPIIEIKSRTGFYDYDAKYIDEQTKFLFDSIGDPKLIEEIEATALECFNVLGCDDFARVDFILGQDQRPYVLEVNTIPGLTEHSLLPKAAAKAGISMNDLCVRIVEAALKNKTAYRR